MTNLVDINTLGAPVKMDDADLMARGYARPGTLALHRKHQTVVRIEKAAKVNYYYTDEDGKSWKIPFRGLLPAPEGAIFSGPEDNPRERRETRKMERDARGAVLAAEFRILDEVQMKSAKDRAKFPGTYVITKRTSPGRFKLVPKLGEEYRGLTAPASLIEKV